MDFGKHREREKGREHTLPVSQAPSREFAPRERSNPEPRALRIAPFNFAVWLRLRCLISTLNRTQIVSFNFAVRLRLRITPRSHPSTSLANPKPRSYIRLHRDRTLGSHQDGTDRTEIAIEKWFGFDEFDRISPNLMNFFFVGFCFCVYLLRNDIIYLFGSWENVRNKKKMCFLYYFQQHNQILENIFQIIFWNATKYLKIFSFPENSISQNYLFFGRYST